MWSANPFSSKKPTSCVPHLHRKPVTRRGSLLAGLGWVLANQVPPRFAAKRTWCLERAAAGLGEGKYRAFRRAAKAERDERTEVVFIGDSAQGDAFAARRMIDDAEHGARAWAFIHDLTREVAPGRMPEHEDARIAIRHPFRHSDAWRSPRLNYFKTTPEAAFLLAQHGFLTRASLRRIVDATRREMADCPFAPDQVTIARLARQRRDSCVYADLLVLDLAKCEALIGAERFWGGAGGGDAGGGGAGGEARALATEEVGSPRRVPARVRRSEEAHGRAQRAAAYREHAEEEWRKRLGR